MTVMNLYGCGGAGINISNAFLKIVKDSKENGFAIIQPYLIDTSRSNIDKDAPDDHIYLFEMLDGSGKKRDSNYTAISEKSREMLHRFKPSEINVVVHSASGGSGSVIGPLLTQEIFQKNNAIVVLIGSSDSRIETENTIKTLKSYEMISKKKDRPISIFYYENTIENNRGSIDSQITRDLIFTSVFFSGVNRELDSADLNNFLNYPKVTGWPSSLSLLSISLGTNSVKCKKDEVVTSVVTLIDDVTAASLDTPVEYQAVGFISNDTLKAIAGSGITLPFHLVNTIGAFGDTIKRLSEKLETFNSFRSTVVHKNILDSKDHAEANQDGMIL